MCSLLSLLTKVLACCVCVSLCPQSFWNCWNNGVGSTAYTSANAPLRRCATFRQSTNPALVANDCQKTPTGKGGAQFNDFNLDRHTGHGW